MKKSKRHNRARHPGLWIFLSLLLPLAATAGLWAYARTRPLLPSQRAPGPADASSFSLWTPPEPYEAAPAEEAVEEAVKSAYDYREILAEEDGILIARIQGKRHRGVLAVVEDPTRLFVGSIPYYGENAYGMVLDRLMERHGAVLGLNGGGFDDTAGQGRGASPQGVVIADGTMWLGYPGGVYDVCAFTEDGALVVGRRTGQELLDMGVHSAVSFGPALIIDGEIQDLPSPYWEPRSAVGQRADGSILLLALEGRQVAAQGADLATLAQVMADYGAVNATNLDGGASTSLLYKGQLMHNCNSVGGLRGIPTAILVRSGRAEGEGPA